MGKTTKNILIILGILSIGFAGYYLYNERFATVLQFDSNSDTLTNMLNNTQVFMERNRVLQRTNLDISIFEDEQFRSLRGFSGPLVEVAPGRPDPFADTDSSPIIPTRQ
jgi:hypothetical protein